MIAGVLGAGLFLTGCGTTVVERDRYHHGYGSRDRNSSVYVDSRYDNGYDRHRTDQRDDRTRDGERTRVNVNKTTVNQTTVNRRSVNQPTTNTRRVAVQSNVKVEDQNTKNKAVKGKKHGSHDEKTDQTTQQQ